MIVVILANSERIEVPVGLGDNTIAWLALYSSFLYARRVFPHKLVLADRVLRHKDGEVLDPRLRIRESLVDEEMILIEFTKFDGSSDSYSLTTAWSIDAYGPKSHLCQKRLEWVGEDTSASSHVIPKSVVGTVLADSSFSSLYRWPSDSSQQAQSFEIPLEPLQRTSGQSFRWMGNLRCPPGIAKFRFVCDVGNRIVYRTSSAHPLSSDGEWNEVRVEVDVPYVTEPLIKVPKRIGYSKEFAREWDAVMKGLEVRKSREVPDTIQELKPVFYKYFKEILTVCQRFSKLRGNGSFCANEMHVEDLYYLLKWAARGEWKTIDACHVVSLLQTGPSKEPTLKVPDILLILVKYIECMQIPYPSVGDWLERLCYSPPFLDRLLTLCDSVPGYMLLVRAAVQLRSLASSDSCVLGEFSSDVFAEPFKKTTKGNSFFEFFEILLLFLDETTEQAEWVPKCVHLLHVWA